MDANLKKALRAISLEQRHTLEGTYDERGDFQPGDLEQRLNAIGVWRDRAAKPLTELTHLPAADKDARQTIDAYLHFRAEAGVGQADAVAEFVREAAYNWANRLLTLRCMEARGIIDEVILQKEVYGGRSLLHNRLGQRDPALLAQPDEGLFTVLLEEFGQRARELPTLFNPKAPAIALRPSLAALKKCIGLLSGTVKAGNYEAAGDELFAAPDALGWAYQYWNAEEKDRVFEKVRTEKGAKIAGADIIPATQLYTEPYMVKFLVQNSLGALWLGMHPDSDLADGWEYYVRDADRAPVAQKSVRDITFLDPACGSGHFHLEAFDLLYAMYEAEAAQSPIANLQSPVSSPQSPEEICAAILNHNLYGIDIDERAIQIAQAALWMKAKEVAWDLEPEALTGFHHHFVATNIKLPQGVNHLEAFLRKHPEDLPLRPALETVFEGLENAHELGSLLQLEEPVEKELRYLQGKQAEVAQTLQQGELFAELAQPRQGALPLGVESYDAWKMKTLAQLRAHFEAEAEAADLRQAFFGQSGGKGLTLFDILARRYDVVTANPPYMGSKNMGGILKKYLQQNYMAGKRDLYAAFILRCINLCELNGKSANITQQSWMFQKSYETLRAIPEKDVKKYKQAGKFTGVLRENQIEVLVHLGEHAFEDSAAAGAFATMFILANKYHFSNEFLSYRLVGQKSSTEKASLLQDKQNLKDFAYKVRQQELLSIERSPIIYSLESKLLAILAQGRQLRELADIRQGVATTQDVRFLKYDWEIQNVSRWLPYEKGEGYARWTSLTNYRIDWTEDGIRIKARIDQRPDQFRWFNRMPYSDAFFRVGLTFSVVGRGSLGVRFLSNSIFAGKSPFVFTQETDNSILAAYLNSRLATYFLRNLAQGIEFGEGYVRRLPYPPSLETNDHLTNLANQCLSLKQHEFTRNLLDRSFDGVVTERKSIFVFQVIRAHSEMIIDLTVLNSLSVSEKTRNDLTNEVGVLPAYFPLIFNYHQLPELPGKFVAKITTDFLKTSLQKHEKKSLETNELLQLKERLEYLYSQEAIFEINDEIDSEEDFFDEENDNLGALIPTPVENLLEVLAKALQIHPVSIYWLLKEGIEQEGWRCPPEEKRLAEDRFTVTVLRLLGHRWPKQIEAGESAPAWSEPSGIIPITNNSPNQATLYDRVRDRLAADFPDSNPSSIEREFADIVGEKLSDWLAGSFFTRHISQFKKRPIAWQLQTSAAPGQRQRGGSAFAALIYYHKLSADLLPTLRNQTIRDLIRAYETEQRTLRQSQNRSSEQETRLHQLETWLTELQTFSDALQFVSDHGFGDTSALQATLRQYALDDAMQSLKATWLRRLADKAAADALTDWQTRADKTGIHPALRDWIAAATANLHHHCAQVGAPAPKATKLKTDPDARALAVIIGTQAKEMVAQSLKLAGDAWFSELDTHVLRPLLDEINDLKAQQAALETERETLAAQDTRALYENEQAIKSLKAAIRKKNKTRSDYRKTANELREHIESWRCPAAATWTDWLGQQPLFDSFTSLDGQRQPPQTIAEFVMQESRYAPDINDGVRVNIAPLQKAGLLAADVLAAKDVDKAIADRADWRADERRWCREGKLPRPGWWTNSE